MQDTAEVRSAAAAGPLGRLLILLTELTGLVKTMHMKDISTSTYLPTYSSWIISS